MRLLAGASVIAATFMIAATALAQHTVTPDSGVRGPGGEKFNVAVVNQTGAAVRFVLRPKAGTWEEYALDSNKKAVYSCYGCGGAFEIKIRTEGTNVAYDIVSGKLYAIRVNPARNIFDVYEVP